MENFDAYSGGEAGSTGGLPFENDGYSGYDPRLPSQRFDSSFRMPEEGFEEEEHHYPPEEHRDLGAETEYGMPRDVGYEDVPGDAPPTYRSPFDDDLSTGAGGDGHSPAMSSPFGGQSFESRLQPEFPPMDDFSASVDSNGKPFHGDAFGPGEVDSMYGYPPPPSVGGSLNGGAVLPPPEEMQPEEGQALREWRRQNAIHLEEKARLEREQLSQIIDAADAFKDEFYEKRKLHCEAQKKNNRDKEKVFLENMTTFHATADKHYWKAVAELVPTELPSVESKSRKDKDKKKPAVVINHGPKPGKATDLSRMRQVLVKLKHNPPAHMLPPPPPPADSKAAADGKAAPATAEGGAPPAAPAPLQTQGSTSAIPVA